MKKVKSVSNLILLSIISICMMAIVDGIINPGYIYKSSIKLSLFLVIPLLYSLLDKNIKLKTIFKISSKKQLLMSIILGIAIYMIILAAYFILRGFIDLENIKDIIEKNLNVNKSNFVFVALYISFVNSLLEEFFFRGFIFLNLKKIANRGFAYIYSAFAFAVYHIAIMTNWFTPYLFILAMVGLFVGGLIFDYLNDKSENIYNSWLVHMFANFAINTVGFIMFGII